MAGPSLKVGTKVEAQSGFDGSWQAGFVVAEVTEIGYLLRRVSDGALLPELRHEQVRRQRTHPSWFGRRDR
jgi:hypothetical protein